jgi:hypothetical protein
MQNNDEYLIIERLGQAMLVSFFNVVVGWPDWVIFFANWATCGY